MNKQKSRIAALKRVHSITINAAKEIEATVDADKAQTIGDAIITAPATAPAADVDKAEKVEQIAQIAIPTEQELIEQDEPLICPDGYHTVGNRCVIDE